MEKAHYIIFHPDHQRQLIKVQALALINQCLHQNWTGSIYVDKISVEGDKNEDPFVFNEPWLYSYCHATQLRRNERKDSYLRVGSKIIFASGQEADKGILCIDTIFLVGNVQQWGEKQLLLPSKYRSHYKNNKSELWRRHLKFPFEGCHEKVSHSYEAVLWSEIKNDYSFIPLDDKEKRVSVSLEKFPTYLSSKIKGKVKGKYPVLLTENEMSLVIEQIECATETKVLKILSSYNPPLHHDCIVGE